MDKTKIAVDVITHFRRPNPGLLIWLHQHNMDVREVVGHYDVCHVRRQSMYNFVENDIPRGYQYLLQIDEDIVPDTDGILAEPGDLVYCGYVGRQGHRGHHGNNDFGCGCARYSAELAQKVDLMQAFHFSFDSTGTVLTSCECNNFQAHARTLGYAPKMVGIAGHLISVVAKPGRAIK